MAKRTLIALLLLLIFVALTCSKEKSTEPDHKEELKESTVDLLGIYNAFPDDYTGAMALGSRIVNIPSEGTFFVYYLPQSFAAASVKRVMVMLHEGRDNAYERIVTADTLAKLHGFGLVAIQWGWPEGADSHYVYLKPPVTQGIISLALEYMHDKHGVDMYLSSLDGVGRAAIDIPEHAFWDRYYSTNFFSLFLDISGGCSMHSQLMEDLLSKTYGDTPLDGCHFYFWCGSEDELGVTCMRMQFCRDTIEYLGGIVDTFVVSTEPGQNCRGSYYKYLEYPTLAIELWDSLNALRQSE